MNIYMNILFSSLGEHFSQHVTLMDRHQVPQGQCNQFSGKAVTPHFVHAPTLERTNLKDDNERGYTKEVVRCSLHIKLTYLDKCLCEKEKKKGKEVVTGRSNKEALLRSTYSDSPEVCFSVTT